MRCKVRGAAWASPEPAACSRRPRPANPIRPCRAVAPPSTALTADFKPISCRASATTQNPSSKPEGFRDVKCAFQAAICILQPLSSLPSADTSQGWGRQQPTSVGSARPGKRSGQGWKPNSWSNLLQVGCAGAGSTKFLVVSLARVQELH